MTESEHLSDFHLLLQDSSKIEHLTKECEESTNMIPKLEDDIPKLQKLLLDEERVLEDIVENSKGCVLSLVVHNWKFFFILFFHIFFFFFHCI